MARGFLGRNSETTSTLDTGGCLRTFPWTDISVGISSHFDNALSCPRGKLVIARYDDSEKKCGALRSRALSPGAIFYKPLIKVGIYRGKGTGLEHGE